MLSTSCICLPLFDLSFVSSLFELSFLQTSIYSWDSAAAQLNNFLLTAIYLGWNLIFHYLVPMVAIVCALAVPFVANPVHSLLALIICFMATSSVLIANNAEFMGYLFLIVYVGAIAILFLFVIMLLNVRQLTVSYSLNLPKEHLFFYFVGATIGWFVTLKFLLELFSAVSCISKVHLAQTSTSLTAQINHHSSDLLAFAELLYTQHAGLFGLAALLLLSAMVGAIVLATSSTERS